MSLDWKGDLVKAELEQHIGEALVEFGLRVEGGAKHELVKGHGVITGTLRRSIHIATPGYNWGADNVTPADGTPERGGNAAEPKVESGHITLQIGSGLEYALGVHQGHHSFEGYHFITNALEAERGKLSAILKRHGL